LLIMTELPVCEVESTSFCARQKGHELRTDYFNRNFIEADYFPHEGTTSRQEESFHDRKSNVVGPFG
jgi:hypothetical protein